MGTRKKVEGAAALGNVDRREFLKGAAAVAGVAVLGPSMAACDGDSSTTSLKPLRGDGTSPLHYIDNVVILQMENRSFDHYFGSLSLDEGRTDVTGLRADMANPTTAGGLSIPLEWLQDDYIISPDPGHSYEACHRQWNGGANDGFIQDWERLLSPEDYDQKIGWAMGYYKRPQLPVLYSLADNFTLCDKWFCSMLGPTWPNRKYSMGATSEGTTTNAGQLKSATPYRAMREKGLSVNVYAAIEFFHFGLVVTDLVRPKAKKIKDFFNDCENGTLPNVSLIEPNYALNDDHPPQDIRLGQTFINSIYEALRNSPQWERSLMLVFYDEHGGFYDSVAPPKVQGEERASENFDQLGFRVPGLVIGPLVKRGHVLSETIDHSSVPSLISRIFEVPHVNKRSELAGDLSAALDIELIEHAKRVPPPPLPKIEVPHSKIRFALAQPFGQPELRDFARKLHGEDLPSMEKQLQDAEDFYLKLEQMRVARVTDN